jgi:hypothetical protein
VFSDAVRLGGLTRERVRQIVDPGHHRDVARDLNRLKIRLRVWRKVRLISKWHFPYQWHAPTGSACMRIGLEYDINIMGHWHQELLLPRAIVCNTLLSGRSMATNTMHSPSRSPESQVQAWETIAHQAQIPAP